MAFMTFRQDNSGQEDEDWQGSTSCGSARTNMLASDRIDALLASDWREDGGVAIVVGICITVCEGPAEGRRGCCARELVTAESDGRVAFGAKTTKGGRAPVGVRVARDGLRLAKITKDGLRLAKVAKDEEIREGESERVWPKEGSEGERRWGLRWIMELDMMRDAAACGEQ